MSPLTAPDAAPPELLLVHGAMGTRAVWRELVARLPTARALALPGHTQGEPLTSIEAYAAWVLSQTDRPCVLVGYAMGGTVAIEATLRAPERVSGLVLVNSGARIRVVDDFFRRIDEDYAEAAAHVWRHAAGAAASADVVEATIASALEVGARTARADFEVVSRWDALDRVAAIQAPTLVVAGADDVFTPPRYSAYLAEKIAGAELVVIPGAGHSVPLEAPDQLAEHLTRFLATRIGPDAG